jgi:hypothetical protein
LEWDGDNKAIFINCFVVDFLFLAARKSFSKSLLYKTECSTAPTGENGTGGFVLDCGPSHLAMPLKQEKQNEGNDPARRNRASFTSQKTS